MQLLTWGFAADDRGLQPTDTRSRDAGAVTDR
jgi:hypothetical protein